jgi:hypothetical protein
MKRAMAVLGVTCVILGLGAGSALASSGQVNGQGQTPLSASLGFNAQSDLSGSLNYNADPNGPNSGFSAHCNDYTSYTASTTKGGFPKVVVTATCTDQDGTTVYMKGGFIDRGEPGVNDWLCIVWNYRAPREWGAFIHDMGFISNGNIQIHE